MNQWPEDERKGIQANPSPDGADQDRSTGLTPDSPQLRAIQDNSRRQFRGGQWLGEEEFWSQVEKALPKRLTKPKKKGV